MDITFESIMGLIAKNELDEALRQTKMRYDKLEEVLEEMPLEKTADYSLEEWEQQRRLLVEEIAELYTLITTIETDLDE